MTLITGTVSRVGAWLLVVCMAVPAAGLAAEPGGSTFVAGHARFEFLTPSLLRMEYSPSGAFVDAPTAVVQKRDWAAVAVRSAREHGWLVLSTDAMTLRYRLQSGPFTAGREQLSAYYEIETQTEERALEIAGRILDDHVTAVELRAIHDSAPRKPWAES